MGPQRGRADTSTEKILDDASGLSVRARVRVFWDGGALVHWAGKGQTLTIGRSPDCHVSIDHHSVSRAHARLEIGPPMFIEDLGSVNAVRVRGARIPPRERVR